MECYTARNNEARKSSQLYTYKFLTVRESENVVFRFPVLITRKHAQRELQWVEWANLEHLQQLAHGNVTDTMPDSSRNPHVTIELQTPWEYKSPVIPLSVPLKSQSSDVQVTYSLISYLYLCSTFLLSPCNGVTILKFSFSQD